MKPRLKPLHEQTIVITGASSGVGLATARMAAKAGANVVLAARNGAALSTIAAEIEGKGGRALAIPCDVGDDAQVRHLARAARETFGRIDTWVNNAGVDIFGELMKTPDEDSRKLFDTNFWGVVHGSRAAVEAMQGQGGALVTVGSIASDRAFGLQGMYCASKHAVKGYIDALRMELEANGVPVSVTLVKPASVKTPLPEQARNYLPYEPKLPPPLYKPDDVATAILHAATHPVRDIHVGSAGIALTLAGAFAPRLVDRIGEMLIYPAQERAERATPRRDNLYAPGPKGGQVEGDAGSGPAHPSISLRAALNPGASLLFAAALGIGLLGALRPSRRTHRR